MAAIAGYTKCCSANILCSFGQSFDDVNVQRVDSIVKQATAQIEELKRHNHHTVVTAIIIRKQQNAKEALEKLGFKAASGWMQKPDTTEAAERAIAAENARFVNARKTYTDRKERGVIPDSDYKHYMEVYSEKKQAASVADVRAIWKQAAKDNDDRATMLFYLPLIGEEE